MAKVIEGVLVDFAAFMSGHLVLPFRGVIVVFNQPFQFLAEHPPIFRPRSDQVTAINRVGPIMAGETDFDDVFPFDR